MSLPQNIKEWYQQFLQLAAAEGVDVNSPASGSMFRSVNISAHSRMYKGELETEYRDDSLPLSAPLNEVEAHRDDPMWLFENTQPISRMNEEQIRNLYALAQEGKVAFETVVNVNGEPKKERKLVYTGTDTLPHFSGPLSQGPLVEDRNAAIPNPEMERMGLTFPNAPDPVALAELSTRLVMASNIAGLNFALSGEERDRRIETAMIYGELVEDRTNHPNYYETPENAALRSKIVASSTFRSVADPQAKMPEQYRLEKDYHFQVSKGVERNILSVSTSGMSLDDMISAGLIRKENGTPYSNRETPWDARTEMAGDIGHTIQVYRPGENGGEPQLDGTVTLQMKARLIDIKKTYTERSAAKKEAETTFKGVEAHKTVYGGVQIAVAQKKSLEQQPASEFLSFDPRPDGSFNMRYKLPEYGRAKNREFKIRENMNYFLRGVSRFCFDSKGNFDFSQFDKFNDDFLMMSLAQKTSPEFAERLGVPADKREDFYSFIRGCEDNQILRNELCGFDDMVGGLRQFQYSLDKLYQPDQPVDSAKEKLMMESYGDFQKKLENLRKMSAMDPMVENRTFNYLDCGSSATINRDLLTMVNAYREQRNLSPVPVPAPALDSQGGKIVIGISKKNGPDNPAANNYNSFDNHASFALTAKLNGRDVLLSMETSAPRAGKLLFSDARGETGMGVYKDKAELAAFHLKDSYYHVENMETYYQIKKVPKRVCRQISNVRGSHIIETKLRTGAQTSRHTAEELSKRLASRKVDHPLISSSPEFAAMKDYFQKFTNAGTPADKLSAIRKLNIAAQVYLDRKEPKGDAVKTAALSDYAKRRLEFARDVLEYTSVKLNQLHTQIPIVSEIKKRKLMENRAPQQEVPAAPVQNHVQPQESKGGDRSLNGP